MLIRPGASIDQSPAKIALRVEELFFFVHLEQSPPRHGRWRLCDLDDSVCGGGLDKRIRTAIFG